MNNLAWRCVLAGGESLLLECLRILEGSGHEIVGVVAPPGRVRASCAERGLRIFADAAALLEPTDRPAFDYLFSVTNLSILPAAVLALPRRGAINFHDGLLPQRGGLYSTTWALVDGEPEHGVTWHRMTSRVDEGDLLAQLRFPIRPDDTAHTLNLKCLEAGIASFRDLIGLLSSNPDAVACPAQPVFRFHAATDRPEAAAAIRWDGSLEAASRLVRALEFADRRNPLSVAKVSLGGRVLRLRAAEAHTRPPLAAPGTISAVDSAGVTVCMPDGELRLARLEWLDGRPVDPVQDGQALGLCTGARFDVIDGETAARLSALGTQCAPSETLWRRRLAGLRAGALPFPPPPAIVGVGPIEHTMDGSVSAAAVPGADQWSVTLAGWLGLLARLLDDGSFDVALRHREVALATDGIRGWFAGQVPLRAEVAFDRPFASFHDAVLDSLDKAISLGTFACDLICRTPGLENTAGRDGLPDLPVGVDLVEDIAAGTRLPGTALTLAIEKRSGAARWCWDAARIDDSDVAALRGLLSGLLAAASAGPSTPLGQLRYFRPEVNRDLLVSPESVGRPTSSDCIHHQIERQVARTPGAVAVTAGARTLTYTELDARANRLARMLQRIGVRPGGLVGVMLPRDADTVVAVLAILKTGAAYVPLDPSYPVERIATMAADAQLVGLVTKAQFADRLATAGMATICIDRDHAAIDAEDPDPVGVPGDPDAVAYVIYTSGSTGRPKGVVVEHRNVAGFFAGMDRHLEAGPGATWLALTSLNFDISVLELLWTLARGFHVVVASADAAWRDARSGGQRPIDFSLFYFAGDGSTTAPDKYRLLLEGARFADRNGFAAVWTPERHFHAFGGLYPNPAVTGAAVAAVTSRVQVRAGSVVLPLHHPARVAEEWSVVDNLSGGRVGIAFASGWHPDDFLLNPAAHADAKGALGRGLHAVRQLWRGEKMAFPGPLGSDVTVTTLPRPIQAELPCWITSAGNVETFREAGRLGANVLTHLLGQSLAEVTEKIGAYRDARRHAGHPGEGYVSLMLHTFVGPDAEQVRKIVRGPLIEYLRSSANLVKQHAWTFPAFRRSGTSAEQPVDLSTVSPDDMAALLEHAFERYFESSGLFGTPTSCMAMIDRVRAAGVDDVACLIDFGVDVSTVIDHLPFLDELRQAAQSAGYEPIASLLRRLNVTHLQCTPSLSRVLLDDDDVRACLPSLDRLLVGGEAMSRGLASDLCASLHGPRLLNMYGPTETTVWSSAHRVAVADGPVPLGGPLAGQSIYLLDSRQQPVPVGVAGELVIAGAGVARGYHGRADLTAERFLLDDIGPSAGGRMYRTGDLGRMHRDGSLEFLGRLDHQVKIRGHRIELGEIEVALAAQPGVAGAVAVARKSPSDEDQIVAYVTAQPGLGLDGAMLRETVRGKLPEVMVPAQVLVLEAFPRTPNGKLDRNALPPPSPVAVRPASGVSDPPQTDVQCAIAEVWKPLFGLQAIGIDDDFFGLGGHSLLAIQLQMRVRDRMGVNLTLADIVRFPTVRGMAERVLQLT